MIRYELLNDSCLDAVTWFSSENFCLFHFTQTVMSLSSAVLNGGLRPIQQCLNLSVPIKADSSSLPSPEDSLLLTFQQLDADKSHPFSVIDNSLRIGLMTAASMKSLRCCLASIEMLDGTESQILVAVTCGLANARTAGEVSDERLYLAPKAYTPGTINIIVYCSFQVSQAAMVEAHMMIAEAKAHVMQAQSVMSCGSGESIATGTGTDATVLTYPLPSEGISMNKETSEVKYMGKHTLLGEALAQCVIRALTQSIQYK